MGFAKDLFKAVGIAVGGVVCIAAGSIYQLDWFKTPDQIRNTELIKSAVSLAVKGDWNEAKVRLAAVDTRSSVILRHLLKHPEPRVDLN